MKLDLAFDDWTAVADALEEQGRVEKAPRLLELAALIQERLGLLRTAEFTRDEAQAIAERFEADAAGNNRPAP